MYLAQSFAVVIKNISSKFLSLSNPYRKALLALVDFFLILLSLLVSAFPLEINQYLLSRNYTFSFYFFHFLESFFVSPGGNTAA